MVTVWVPCLIVVVYLHFGPVLFPETLVLTGLCSAFSLTLHIHGSHVSLFFPSSSIIFKCPIFFSLMSCTCLISFFHCCVAVLSSQYSIAHFKFISSHSFICASVLFMYDKWRHVCVSYLLNFLPHDTYSKITAHLLISRKLQVSWCCGRRLYLNKCKCFKLCFKYKSANTQQRNWIFIGLNYS